MELVRPSDDYLPSYVSALRTGWSADNIRGAAAAAEELQKIDADADRFLASLHDREARGDPIKLPDGSTAACIPGYNLWMWDGEFCGDIGFRWVPGTSALPLHVLGHVGYSVVPWKRGRGYATQALKAILPAARNEGLQFVEITTDTDNVASQRVVISAGGVLIERFKKPDVYGGAESLRFRIFV